MPEERWTEIRKEAHAGIYRDSKFRGYGSDLDAEAAALSLENAKKAGVDSRLRIRQADIADFTLPDFPAAVICNPPYGRASAGDQAGRGALPDHGPGIQAPGGA